MEGLIMELVNRNGVHKVECPIVDEFKQHIKESKVSMLQIAEMHRDVKGIAGHTSHLKQLDILPEIRDKWIDAVLGKKQMDNSSVKMIMGIYNAIIAVLLGVIFFVITGRHFGFMDVIPK